MYQHGTINLFVWSFCRQLRLLRFVLVNALKFSNFNQILAMAYPLIKSRSLVTSGPYSNVSHFNFFIHCFWLQLTRTYSVSHIPSCLPSGPQATNYHTRLEHVLCCLLNSMFSLTQYRSVNIWMFHWVNKKMCIRTDFWKMKSKGKNVLIDNLSRFKQFLKF